MPDFRRPAAALVGEEASVLPGIWRPAAMNVANYSLNRSAGFCCTSSIPDTDASRWQGPARIITRGFFEMRHRQMQHFLYLLGLQWGGAIRRLMLAKATITIVLVGRTHRLWRMAARKALVMLSQRVGAAAESWWRADIFTRL